MLNNRFPIPNQNDGNGNTTSHQASSPYPDHRWSHYQRHRHHRHSNQQHHHDQHGDQMENNRHQERSKQSKSGIRDPNNILQRRRERLKHFNHQQQQQQQQQHWQQQEEYQRRHLKHRALLQRQLPPAVGIGVPADGSGSATESGSGSGSDCGDTVMATATTAEALTKPSIGGRKGNYQAKAKAFIIEFLQEASLHGFIYLSKVGLHFVERVLWLVFICIAFFGVVSLSHRTWERFQTSPMVISMDRNKLLWNTSFPSLTVCPHKRVDENKVEEFLQIHKQNFPTDEDKEDFRVFIEKLASLSYDNIESLPMNKTFSIPSAKYLDILFELKWNFEPELSSGTTVKMNMYQTITELGICYSVNTLVGQYSSYEYWLGSDWNLLDHGDRVTVHPLDGEIYAQIINLSTGYDVYFHSAGDIPNMSKQRYTFPESDYTTVELIALETFTTPRARELKINQRKCRFPHEADEMMTVPIYSYGLCLTECRMKLALRVCKCVPHFYRNRVKGGRTLPVCDFNGLSCLAQIKKEIISLKSDTLSIDCKCLANCDDSNFFVQSYRSRVWFLGANLQWGIIDYPKMQLRRDVLFSFADVLVYIGGLAGFFLGCSILTFTEIIYFFTARFFRRVFL